MSNPARHRACVRQGQALRSVWPRQPSVASTAAPSGQIAPGLAPRDVGPRTCSLRGDRAAHPVRRRLARDAAHRSPPDPRRAYRRRLAHPTARRPGAPPGRLRRPRDHSPSPQRPVLPGLPRHGPSLPFRSDPRPGDRPARAPRGRRRRDRPPPAGRPGDDGRAARAPVPPGHPQRVHGPGAPPALVRRAPGLLAQALLGELPPHRRDHRRQRPRQRRRQAARAGQPRGRGRRGGRPGRRRGRGGAGRERAVRGDLRPRRLLRVGPLPHAARLDRPAGGGDGSHLRGSGRRLARAALRGPGGWRAGGRRPREPLRRGPLPLRRRHGRGRRRLPRLARGRGAGGPLRPPGHRPGDRTGR